MSIGDPPAGSGSGSERDSRDTGDAGPADRPALDARLRDGPHAFVEDLERPRLADDDRHHLERVLRVREGDALSVSDGAGRWRPCQFAPELVTDGPVVAVPRPVPALTVGFALVKGERPELIVQKLTELGIDRIVPFVAARSVVRWDAERGRRQLSRLRKVAREAAMQSRRSWLPEVDEVLTVAAMAESAGTSITRADPGGAPPTLDRATVLIGPEGGWSPEEQSLVAHTTGFGDHVLRSETAAISAAAILAALRGGLVHTNH